MPREECHGMLCPTDAVGEVGNVFTRHRAVTDKSIRSLFIHLAHGRPRYFYGFIAGFFLTA